MTPADLAAIAVTVEPGLIGSLLVGLNAAKGMAVALKIPLVEVHHIEAHLLSVLLEEPDLEFPWLALVVSGGHTLLYDVRGVGSYELLGATRDDAAGEAFDKGAKLLGLGYPGGPMVDRLAAGGDPTRHRFPRSMMEPASNDFSFSGVKTALRYFLRDNHPDGAPTGSALADICASYQEAIVDALVTKTIRIARSLGRDRVAAVGGVAVNSRLRAKFTEASEAAGLSFHTVRPIYGTDNAAMIGIVGWKKFQAGTFAPLTTIARASMIRSGKGRKKREPKGA
jgi:N6-L-threonylcarbamoyladenine synthase